MIVQRGTLPWIDIKRDTPGHDATNGPLWSNERKEKKKKDSQRWNDDDVEWDGLWEKKKRTKGKIRLLAVARNNGTRLGNWQWGEKVMEAVLVSFARFLWSIWSSWLWSPLSLGSVLDSRVVCRVGTRIYYSAACFTSAAETIGKRERKRAGPQTFEGHSHLSISSLLSFLALSLSFSLSLSNNLSIYLSISRSRVVYSCRQCGWSREALLHELDNRSELSTRVWIENIFRVQCAWCLTTRWNGSSIDWVYTPVYEFGQPARSYKMRWLVQINDVL